MSFTGTQQKCKACDKTVYLMDQLSADGVAYHKSCFKCNHCKNRLQVHSSSIWAFLLHLLSFLGMLDMGFTLILQSCWLFKILVVLGYVKLLHNYSSMEGVLYCKPHFEQLFKEAGSFNKNFQSPTRVPEQSPDVKPELVKIPRSYHDPLTTSWQPSLLFSDILLCILVLDEVTKQSCSQVFWDPRKMFNLFQNCLSSGKGTVTVEEKFYHKSCFKCSHGGCSITPSNYAALDGVLYCKHHFSQLFREKGSYAHIMRSASIKRGTAPVPEVLAAPASEA
ncbi:hypothetical protein Cgig2_002198 [Carnegiea gigantea]|uniref:LIM zinc-binding domain-containing protein n=1 Tax=Carnegiea gigantea TaxID=171969 RepID=A0A9Q1KX47_9CARY|nr:hypothetical protein Cgig2_002198 [Carnegiea gigantea]